MTTSRATKPVEFTTRSPEETQQIGERLGACLGPGDVVGLVGELGGGKTTFIQGLAKGLGLDPAHVKSPTFILMREYPGGRVPLIHIDAYRLEGEASIVWLDLEWLLSPRKVTAVEWADRFVGCLPDDHVEIRFAHKSANQRTLTLLPHGLRSSAIVHEMARESSTEQAALRPSRSKPPRIRWASPSSTRRGCWRHTKCSPSVRTQRSCPARCTAC